MSALIQSLRGMPDSLPAEAKRFAALEAIWRDLAAAYGYSEIRLPLLEETALFKRSIGEVTDIIEKEMFSLNTNAGESISLRPEGTAGCVRAGLEHQLFYHQTPRLWYMGPMFRYERPQKGRYRQFHQIGVETFGIADPTLEVEQILMVQRLWKALNIDGSVQLVVNSLGSREARLAYRRQLVDYFNQHRQALDADSLRRLETNPLRILDSKNPALQELLQGAPTSLDSLDWESFQHFHDFLERLKDCKIAYTVDHRLVRGLDYYNRTVYEWRSEQLGAQSALGGGGRYDQLVEQLGGTPTPAVGFSLGVERILLVQDALQTLKQQTAVSKATAIVDVYLIHTKAGVKEAYQLAETIHDALRHLRVLVHGYEASLKHQFKKADQSGARIALIVAEDELAQHRYSVKFLREAREQQLIQQQELVHFLNDYFKDL